jgi:hypothetical protein
VDVSDGVELGKVEAVPDGVKDGVIVAVGVAEGISELVLVAVLVYEKPHFEYVRLRTLRVCYATLHTQNA